MSAPAKYGVHLIRAFTGPRHDRLERIWSDFARRQRRRMRLYIHDNLTSGLSHAAMLGVIWQTARDQPHPYVVVSEFDFLPDPDYFLSHAQLDGATAVVAAEYCTRAPTTRALHRHGVPGAWYLVLDLTRLRDLSPDAFAAGGPHNDPCNLLAARLPPGLKCVLLPTGDCYPRHYGVRVGTRGEHLFWSRHYNDPPDRVVAGGFALGDIQRHIDNVIEEYESDRHRRYLD